MLTKEEILRRLREHKPELQQKFPVKNLALFIIAHEYHGIDHEVIWRIIKVYLPQLKLSIESKLKEI